MPTRAELEDALRKADAAGAKEDAQRLADALSSMPAQPVAPSGRAGPPPFNPSGQSFKAPALTYDEMAASQQKSYASTAPQWDMLATPAQQMIATAKDPMRKADADLQRAWTTGNVGDALSAANTNVRHWWMTTPDKDKVESAGRNMLELSGVPSIARELDNIGRKTGNEFLQDQTGYFQTDENYDPVIDALGWGLNAGTWSTRAAGGGLINPRSAGAAVKNAIADVGTNFTMGASDAAMAGGKMGVKAAGGLADIVRGEKPGSLLPPINQTAVPVTAPQQPAAPAPFAPAAAQTPPAAALTPVPAPQVGQVSGDFARLHPKVQNAFERLLVNSGVEPQRIPNILRELDNLPPDRAEMVATQLIQKFGAGDPKLQTNITSVAGDLGVNAPKPGGDNAQAILRGNVRQYMDQEIPYVEGVAQRNFGPGVAATTEEIDNRLRGLRGQYQSVLNPKRPYGLKRSPTEINKIKTARENLATYLKRVDTSGEIPDWLKRDTIHTLNRDLREMGLEPVERNSATQGFTWGELIDQYPTQIAHALQSTYATAIREADLAKLGDVSAGAMVRDLTEMRGKSRVRANAADPSKRGYGLLHLLEEAAPGYKDLRVKYGTEHGLKTAMNVPDRFVAAANDERKFAALLDDLDEMTDEQYAAAKNQITTMVRNAIKRKQENPTLAEVGAGDRGTVIPNLTQLAQAPVLEGLERAFGEEGKRLADAIRLSRAASETVKKWDPDFNSRTGSNLKNAEGGPNLYEDPLATDRNIVDGTTALLGTMGATQIFTQPHVAAGLMGLAGVRTIWQLIKNGKKLTPAQRTEFTNFLFKLRRGEAPEAIDALPGPSTPPRLPAPDAQSTPTPSPAPASSAPPSPPVKGPVNKAGFFGSGSKPLDMSEAGRMQRAREQGYTIEAYHGTRRDFDEFDVNEAGSNFSQDEGTIHFTDDAKDADRYAMSDTTGMPAEGGSTYPVLLRMKKPLVADRAFFEREGMGNVYANEDRISAWDTYHPFLKERAEEMGADGIILKDSFGKSHYVVFDPKNVRSKFATFDPSQSGSSKLLAGMGKGTGGRIASQVGPPAFAATVASVGPEGEPYEDKLKRMGLAAGLAVGARNAGSIGRLLGAGKGPRNALRGVDQNGIKAYHGSPHDFDKFELSDRTLGTGEGAQAYGHGLYFAENEAVAKGYRDVVGADKDRKIVGREGRLPSWVASDLETGRDPQVLLNDFEGRLRKMEDGIASGADNQPWVTEQNIVGIKQIIDNIKAVASGEAKLAPKGRLYEVDINSAPEDLLDWDKPLSQQSEAVRRKLADTIRIQKVPLKNNMGMETTVGEMIGYLENRFGNKADVFYELKESGIPGIRYLDQGSRNAGDGTRNYVVFDDKHVNILNKSGLSATPEGLGFAGGGALGYATAPDQNGDGVIDANERALGAIGGAVSGGLLVKGAKLGVNALKGGAKAAERVPEQSGFFGGKGPPKPANDTLPKGQKTPAEDLAMAREFNKEPLTPERAYDFWALLKDEKDLNKVIDVLDINLNPSILSLPRGRAMVERTREEVLRRVTTYLRKETEVNKASTLSRANAKFEENNRSIANEITQLRERGVPDQMIARSLGLEDGSLEYFLRWSEPTKPPPAQAGFFSGGKGLTDTVADAYGGIKRGLFPNDPRHLNPAVEALQAMDPKAQALVMRNAGQTAPRSAIEAAETPPQLAELVGRAVSQNAGGADKPIDAAAKSYQTRLAEMIMEGQRNEADLINMDRKAGPIGALEKGVKQSYDWTPGREAEQEALLSAILGEGEKGIGGIPERAGGLDRFREGIMRGAAQEPLMISPRDENKIAQLIFDPGSASEAARLMNAPVKPWVSDLERKAIQVGVPATGLAAMIAAGTSLYNQPGGQAGQEGQPPKPVPGSGPDQPIYTVPDRLMGTSNPSEPPPELNGFNRDTRIRAQQRLSALGFAPMKLKNGSRFDDGVDGPELRQAVSAFQRENDLPVTGDLDPITLRTLWNGKNYGALPTMRNYGEELAPAPQ